MIRPAFCLMLLIASAVHCEPYVASRGEPGVGGSILTIKGNRFYHDGEPIDLWGIRTASAAMDDETTEHLISQLDDYKAHGVNALTVFYMGSDAGHMDPFTEDGTGFRAGDGEAVRDRVDRIVRACDERGMVVVAGIYYQWKERALTRRYLENSDAAKRAVETVSRHLENSGRRNLIINIANEQNSYAYRGEPWENVRNVHDLLELVAIAKECAPGIPVGAGGYSHDKNAKIGLSPLIDVLLFDTLGPDTQEQSGHWHDRFVSQGVVDKPIVNVEMFGAWTERFDPTGVYPEDGKAYHYNEIEQSRARPGLSVFFHSNPWCQGPSTGNPLRFDLGGRGTEAAPGIRWYFERVRDAVFGER